MLLLSPKNYCVYVFVMPNLFRHLTRKGYNFARGILKKFQDDSRCFFYHLKIGAVYVFVMPKFFRHPIKKVMILQEGS